MGNSVRFYTIAIEDENSSPLQYPVNDFFNKILRKLADENVPDSRIVRDIGGKYVRLFPAYTSDTNQVIVIPFGKLKDKNKPFWLNPEKKLEPIPVELFEVNSLSYDPINQVLMLTTNQEGPNDQIIQDYLNSFIPADSLGKVAIKPIFYDAGLQKVRNAALVRSVVIQLDLGKPMNDFYIEQIDNNRPRSLIGAFKIMAEEARDSGGSQILSLVLGLGKHGKKEDTLDLESIMSLLEHINISADFVKEITVKYKDGTENTVDTALLKKSNVIVYHRFNSAEGQVAPEYLLNHALEAANARRNQYRGGRDRYLAAMNRNRDFDFDVVIDYDPVDYYA